MSLFKIAAVSAVLAGSAMGHMVMNTPVPYGFSDLQTAPLNGQNYQFPCQSGSRTDAFSADGANTGVTAGSTTPVKFTGSAVHGGGSCQFSVTYEYPPPADPSKWKVIHTIIGDCPAKAAGNIATSGSDADGRPTGPVCSNADGSECLPTFNIPIPKQLKNGNATFAWTWFNKIGNREMYMNCAPITVSGGSDDESFLNSLPEIFVANIPGHCTTGQGVLNIPNPGKSVEVREQPASGSNGACPAGGSLSGSSSGTSSGSSSSAAPAAPAAPSSSKAAASTPVAAPSASPAPAAPAASSAIPGVFAPGAGSGSGSAASSSAKPAPTGATVIQSSIAAAPTGAAPTGTAPSGASGAKVACSSEGSVVCMGTDYFGLCDHGFAVKMAVAAGTKCQNGQVTRRSLPRKHLHARIHGHHS